MAADADPTDAGRLNPNALAPADAARLLTKVSGKAVPVELIEKELADGAKGDRGGLFLFGDKPERHRLFAEHLCAEYRVKVQARGRTVDEWKIRAEHGDNHWFDGIVGCGVAASIQGSNLANVAPVAMPKKRSGRVSWAKLQRKVLEEQRRR